MYPLDWALILYAIYVPLLLLLYIAEVSSIFRHRRNKFNSSFFRIFGVLAIVNIIACLAGTFVFRLPLYPLVNGIYSGMTENSGWLTAAYSGSYYLNCLSEHLGVLLALNRFTALYMPAKHDKFWRLSLYIGVILCFAVSFTPVLYLFDNSNKFVEVPVETVEWTWYYLEDYSEIPEASIYFNMFIVTVVCNSVSFLLYMACLVKMCWFTKTKNNIAERNFFLVGFLTMIFSLPFMGAMLYFYFKLSIGNIELDPDLEVLQFVAFQLPWLTDLKYLSPAPMLLITNASIRNVLRKKLKCEKAVTITTVS